jgi:cation:H+ antiporter
MDILTLLLGIAFAVYGAQLLVDGGVAIATRFGIPTLVIGSTVVAFGTSMPEFTVNIQSALAGKTDLALGNILGSNLFNIAAIVGIVALITPLAVSSDSRRKDFPMCLIGAVMIGIAGNQLYLDGIKYHELMLSDGLTFLLFFWIFMRYVYAEAAAGAADHHNAKKRAEPEDGGGGLSMGRAGLYVLLGLVGLVFGGEFIVDGATGIARSFGLSERVIGLAIVGPGTSVPELVASIVAALKKQVDMVIGNVLGSNILNVFFTLGATALIAPVPLDLSLNTVVLINIGITAALTAYVRFSDRSIGRPVGLLLVVAYVAYLTTAIMS